jgi:hypothetical protein
LLKAGSVLMSGLKRFAIAVWLAAAVGCLVENLPGDPAAAEPVSPTPIAHWTFDETTNGPTLADHSGHPAQVANANRPLPHLRGVHGRALQLQGTHAIQTRLQLAGPTLSAITFSAWARPLELGSYREIFRQECPNRLLFSFQENGTILSLGLNIGGYLECDASIRPEAVLDGAWHHCAATFDGEVMRVYLDGREIGSLKRPGKITFSPEVPGFIGSLGGQNEHFQGALDDLRIYAQALSPGQIAALYRSGVESWQQVAGEIERAALGVLPAGRTFAEFLAGTRQKMLEKPAGLDPDVVSVIQARLKSRFPAEFEDFRSRAGVSPFEYLNATDRRLNQHLAGRLMDLLVEYMPLTEGQWKTQPPEAARKWREAEGLKQRYDELAARGEAGEFSPEWIDLMLAAGARIQLRPVVHEAVAPFLKPETPSTRDLEPAQGRAVLERDWLYQAEQNPTAERVRDEADWTRQLAARLEARFPGKVDFSRERMALDQLAARAGSESGRRETYLAIRALKRRVMFSNPVLDFDKVLFVDMPFPQGSEWQHETRHRLGYMAVPGARLLVLDGLRPDGKLRQLMPQLPLHGSFWRPDLSFDGRKVVFSFKPHNEKAFHLYEINLDGSGLKQLTDGPYDDLDPIYLPDEEHILFSTTRGHTYVRCMPPTSAFVLARCKRDGSEIYLVSANNEPDYLPSVMNDGRVLYTRWEYTDKPLWRAQKLWTVNPDGSQVTMFWGNQSVWPDVMKDARAIPGSRRIMFTGSAHHNWFSGSVGIIDPDRGLNFPDGLSKVTADVAWPECGNGPVDPVESPRYHASGRYEAYFSPWPLSESEFLVSANRGGRFVLCLMDVEGNRELICEGAHHVLHALPVRARVRPPVIEDRVKWPGRDHREQPAGGVVLSSDVYQGAPAQLRGRAKFLRVFSIDHKTYTYWYKRPYISTGPVVSAVQSEGVKRLLGTVPIEADGSVSFHVPAGTPLHFQLLDQDQRALQTMRSFVGVMPGEYRGCLGCHEAHSRASEVRNNALALAQPPRTITPPPWGDDTVSYPRYVQPVLDRYCGKCHQGNGKARKVLDLTERPSQPIFTEPYLTLIGRPTWGQPYQPPEKPAPGFGIAGCLLVEGYGTVDPKGYVTPPPMTALSYRSRLIEIAASGKHHHVKVDPTNLLRLITWVDAMCPYLGDEEVRQIPDPVFQGVDWLSVRPKIASAPRITRPGPVD